MRRYAGDPEVGRQPSKLNERFRVPPSALRAADSESDVPWTPSKECGRDTRRPLHVVVRQCGLLSAKRPVRVRLPPTTPCARPGGSRLSPSKRRDSVRVGAGAPLISSLCPGGPRPELPKLAVSVRLRAERPPRKRPTPGQWTWRRGYEPWLRLFDSASGDCRAAGDGGSVS